MKGAFVIIYNKRENKILVEKEVFEKGGKYKLVGGTVEVFDKNLDEALKRETSEEVGIALDDFNFLCEFKIEKEKYEFYFYYKIYEDFENVKDFLDFNNFKNLDKEIEGHYWVSIEEFLENSKYESYIFAVNIFLKICKRKA